MRIFLDANILFSAAKTDGAVAQLLDMLRHARHELIADTYVLEEARRNVLGKAPDRLARLEAILGGIDVRPAVVSHSRDDLVQSLPEKDRPVLAAAIRHRCAALVTGERAHFGALYGSTIGGVAIHSPRSLAELLLR